MVVALLTLLARTPPPRLLSVQWAEAPALLRETKRWGCVEFCGACCYLKPEERDDLDDWLTRDERDLYESMVGADGWCVNFDKATRMCKIYDDRPDFCRVEPATFNRMFGVPEDEMDSFCTSCCREHIADVYGPRSDEIRRFNAGIKNLRRRSAPTSTRSAGKSCDD